MISTWIKGFELGLGLGYQSIYNTFFLSKASDVNTLPSENVWAERSAPAEEISP